MEIKEHLALAKREGVLHPENLPFLLESESEPMGSMLLVHGFSASPYETAFFGRLAAKAGFNALGVRLPGHGTFPEDLLTRRHEEWLESVAAGYDLLAKRGLPVYGIGVSTGGLLLLSLAESRSFQRMALLSPFLKMRHPLASSVGALKLFRSMYNSPLPKELTSYYYRRRALNGIFQIQRLVKKVKKSLGGVEASCLVIGAEGDRTVKANSALEIFRLLGSRRKEFHLYGPEVPHVLSTPENPYWRETFNLVSGFFRNPEFDP